MHQRQRNIENNKLKQERHRQQQMEIALKTMAHKNAKDELSTKINQKKMMSSQKTKHEAQMTKEEKNYQKQKLELNRRMEEAKAQNIKSMIKQQQVEAQNKR